MQKFGLHEKQWPSKVMLKAGGSSKKGRMTSKNEAPTPGKGWGVSPQRGEVIEKRGRKSATIDRGPKRKKQERGEKVK